NRFEVWVPVSNEGGAPVYNIEGRIFLQGVDGQSSPIEAQGQLVDGAVLRGDRGCPAMPRAAGRRNVNFIAGGTVPFLLPTQCAALVRAFEIPSSAATQPFSVQVRVTSSTAHSGTADAAPGAAPVAYPELAMQSDPLTLSAIQDLLTLRG